MAISNGWRFSGDLRDYAGLRNHASAIGPGVAQYALGEHGSALVCTEGRGAVATIPAWRYYYQVSINRFAVECWATSLSMTAAPRTLVAKGDAWSLDLSDANGFLRFVHGNTIVTTTTNLRDGEAHHILATYDYTSSDPYVFTYDIYVDGVKVKTSSGHVTTFSDTAADLVHFGCLSEGAQGADALVEDVRIWSDPIHEDEVASVNMVTPVADYELGIWRTSNGTTSVPDLGRLDNDMAITANGQRVGGRSGGVAIQQVANSGAFSAVAPITVEKGIDRFSMHGWFRLTNPGVTQRIIEFSRTSGDPIMAMDLNASNKGTVHAWTDEGDHWIAEQTTASFNPGTWYQIFISIYPGSIRWRFGSRVTMASVPPGFYPLNAPIYTDQDELKLYGQWQDFRLTETYIPPEEWDSWYTQVPFEQLTGGVLGDGTPITPYILTDEGLVLLEIGAVGAPAAPDALPPSVPMGLTLDAVNHNSMTVSWGASVDSGEEPDVTAPSVPTGLVASSVSSTGFTIEWSGSSDS